MKQLPRRHAIRVAVVALLACATLLTCFPVTAAAQVPDGFDRGLVTVSFDDGYQSIYDNALPVMEGLGIDSTQFIVTGNTDTDPFFMTSAELLAMYNLGHELGSHTVTHPDLTTLTPAELDYQLSASKAFLEALTGGAVEDFAYTYGIYNDAVVAAVQQYYAAARSSNPGLNSRTGFDEYLVKSEVVIDTTTPAEVQGWIDDAVNYHYWLVLMYHQIDDAPGEYHTTPADFAQEMQYLHDSGVATLTMRRAMAEIRPWFRQYTVGAVVAGGKGSVSPATQTLGYTDPASIALYPANGFSTSSILDNGVPMPVADPYVIPQVRLDHSVLVGFSANKPAIASFSPGFGPPGTKVTIEGSDFQDARGSSTVTIGGARVSEYASWSNTRITIVVPQGASTGSISVTTGGGTSSGRGTFQVTRPDWYLAEGSTNWGFETYISIANPNSSAVTAAVLYMTAGGGEARDTIRLPASSQTTLTGDHVDSVMGGHADFSTEVRCLEGRSIAVDRTMTWTGPGARSPEGHNSIGAPAPATSWYLPEGSSNWGFETWLLVQNPNPAAARVTITYMREGLGPARFGEVIPAHSRVTFGMEDAIGKADASISLTSDRPVVAERSIYRNDQREGQCSIGTTAPDRDFYLAEGSSAWGFTTYVLIQNPGSSPAEVRVTFMTGEGPVPQAPFVMAADSRKTIRVNDVLPDTDFSTMVTGSAPIVAERSMYWDSGTGEACHDSIGIAAPHRSFLLADGQTSNGRQTWTMVQNPNHEPVKIAISYLKAGGGKAATFTDTVPADSRKTYPMSDMILSGRCSTMVECVTPGGSIVVERSMYWNDRGAGTETVASPAD